MRSKLFTLATLTILFFSSVVAQNKVTEKLIGKWEAKDTEGVTGGLNFIDSVNIIVTIPGQPLPKGNYVIDTTKTPMWFDINIRDGNNILSMKGLLKLVNDNTLKWQIFNDGKRSETFTNEKSDNTIILKRKDTPKN